MVKTTKEILIAARALIERPEAWTQEVFAEDVDGVAVDPHYRGAVCWCASGAISAATYDGLTGEHPGAVVARRAVWVAMLAMDRSSSSLYEFNDSHPHTTVLAAFDKAIAAEPAQ